MVRQIILRKSTDLYAFTKVPRRREQPAVVHVFVDVCILYMAFKNPLTHISNGQLKELLPAPRGNYLKYLDYRCFYKNPLQTQQTAVSPTQPGCSKAQHSRAAGALLASKSTWLQEYEFILKLWWVLQDTEPGKETLTEP